MEQPTHAASRNIPFSRGTLSQASDDRDRGGRSSDSADVGAMTALEQLPPPRPVNQAE